MIGTSSGKLTSDRSLKGFASRCGCQNPLRSMPRTQPPGILRDASIP